ncbi:hypothetical protein D9M73_215740 [compost metagenome]
MSLAVPPILWAGLYLGLPVNPEYFTLGLSLAANSPGLALAAYIGGISAASGLLIVMTLRCPAWCSTTWSCRFTSRPPKATSIAG